MSAMAAAPPPPAPRLDSVLSFSDDPAKPAVAEAEAESAATLAFSDAGSGSGSDTDAEEDADFEFAFAPPLSPRAGAYPALAPADDLFAHGRIIAAYPLFDRHLVNDEAASSSTPDLHQQASTAPPSPDTYCAWAPRSAPGSPSRDYPPPAAATATAAFPKSSSTGEARRFWRLRDLVSGGGGRSHSDGKEKFVFLQPSSSPAAKAAAAPLQKQGKKKTKGSTGKAAAGATEMDMATAHRLFYGKPAAAGAAALASDRTKQQQQSYLPYRPSIVGFFTTAHALGRSHHPY